MKFLLIMILAMYSIYEGFRVFISVAEIAAIKNDPYSRVFDRIISLNGESNKIVKKIFNSILKITTAIGFIILI